MEWGKLFANLPDDPRVQAAEDAVPGAAWLLVESMCYCTRAEHGGFIPRTQVERFGGGSRRKPRIAALVRERLWLRDGTGYELNPDIWNEERNLSDSAEKKKAADRERVRAKRAAAKAAEESRDMSRDSSATDPATGSGDSRTLEERREEQTTTADQVSHLQVPDGRGPDDDDGLIQVVIAEVRKRTGGDIDADQARDVAAKILARRKAGPPNSPAKYVAHAIATEPEPELYADLLAVAPPWLGDPDDELALPPWCGDSTCSERTRMREKPDGTPYRCPECGPRARFA